MRLATISEATGDTDNGKDGSISAGQDVIASDEDEVYISTPAMSPCRPKNLLLPLLNRAKLSESLPQQP